MRMRQIGTLLTQQRGTPLLRANFFLLFGSERDPWGDRLVMHPPGTGGGRMIKRVDV